MEFFKRSSFSRLSLESVHTPYFTEPYTAPPERVTLKAAGVKATILSREEAMTARGVAYRFVGVLYLEFTRLH